MHDYLTMGSHGAIIVALAWIARALQQSGVRFDIRIWRNGVEKSKARGVGGDE